jgi:hypothetical protein
MGRAARGREQIEAREPQPVEHQGDLVGRCVRSLAVVLDDKQRVDADGGVAEFVEVRSARISSRFARV